MLLDTIQIAVDFATLPVRPEVFSIGPFGEWGPFALRWYSLAYLAAIIFSYWHMSKSIKAPGAPMAQRHADDLFFYGTLGVILLALERINPGQRVGDGPDKLPT